MLFQSLKHLYLVAAFSPVAAAFGNNFCILQKSIKGFLTATGKNGTGFYPAYWRSRSAKKMDPTGLKTVKDLYSAK